MVKDLKDEQNQEKEIVNQGVHSYSEGEDYVWPTDERVLKKLEWFKDQKLALMVHWGPCSQLGIVTSWALSDEDAYWSRHQIDWDVTGEEFKKQYFDLNKSFNPVRFQPDKWAEMAKDAGFKYLIFTTKHHDGFCMWDTKYTDYKITGKDCPFSTHKYADICAHLFEAFRRQGIGIAAYFSKADWNVDSYWNEKYARGKYQWRGPSYNPSEEPEEWERFVQFTQNQIKELGTNYGQIDIMWFDAGWVAKRTNQDLRIGEVIDDIRKYQKDMLCVDRTIGGPYENYVTPEQCVPDEPLNVPWESCLTMGMDFAYMYEDVYKTPRQIICTLVDIVAKGGNLALNVSPQPDGRLPEGAINTMKGMGEWLNKFGECIYGTRVCEPYKKDGIAFTQKENERKVYAIYTYPDEKTLSKEEIFIPYTNDFKNIICLNTNLEVEYIKKEKGIIVKLPREEQGISTIAHVFCLNI
ncbi:MAG: alpha-L-fucosidase [Clostridiales bacterium]|nr:alpha-L-fucosidase [Clostridiales bacterium]